MDINDEKYALNWSSHADHIKHAFDKILQANDFVDVTLSCEGKKIKAHRVILSACSSYFYDILKDNPCAHPTIILRGMKYGNIKYLLKFMYCGEVQVPTDDFGSFLETAELLQVSGLTGDDDASGKAPKESKTKDEQDDDDETDITSERTMFSLTPTIETNKRKTSSMETSLAIKKKRESDKLDLEEEFGNFLGSDKEDEVDMSKPMSTENIANVQKLLNDSSYLNKEINPECQCPVCAEKFVNTHLLKQHVAFHLGETKCKICGKVFSRLDSLKKHMAIAHKISFGSMTKKDR